MTRVERNQKTYKKTRKTKSKTGIKKIIKLILRDIIALVVGLVYILYNVLKFINNLIAKLFMKLPRIIRVFIIYSIIGYSIFITMNPQIKVKEVVKEEIIKVQLDKTNETNETKTIENKDVQVVQQSVNTCNLGNIECQIYNKGLEIGLTHEQAIIAVSISKHETGNFTSKAFKNKNNFGGVMCNTGLRTYNSFEDGMIGFINLLKNHYFDKGLNTIEQIGTKYCPVGASNDPNGQNQYWIPNVSKYYYEFLNK